jgi:putative two-component system response regulator
MANVEGDPHLESILKLAFVAEFRDPDTQHHLRRIGLLAELVARQLGWSADDAFALRRAAPMHDIGTVAIPDSILLKPGKLTPEEREVKQQHTILGSRMLLDSETPELQLGEVICLTHHERFDGSGYPHGLSGADIPMSGRIVGLVDVYDALVNRRVYKPALSHDEAQSILRSESGRHFDPDVVAALFGRLDDVMRIYQTLQEEDEDRWVT